MEKAINILESNKETVEDTLKDFQEFYKGTDTILGNLKNLYLISNKDKIDRKLLLIKSSVKEKESELGKYKLIYHTVIKTDNNEIYREENGSTLFYRYLIGQMPYYKNLDIDEINHNLEKNNRSLSVPRLLINKGFIYPMVRCHRDYDVEEGKKIYLDVGTVNFYPALEKVLNFYVRLKNEIDGNTKNLISKIYQFKSRLGYAKDAIVFRLVTEEQYEIFLDLLSRDKELLSLLNFTNPFVNKEQIDGHTFGVIPNDDESYNEYVSIIVHKYIMDCVDKDKEPDLISFMKFVEDNYLNRKIFSYIGNRYMKSYGNILIEQIDKEMTR